MSSSAAPLQPSGNGHSRETAQWSHALTGDPNQPAYIVNAVIVASSTWRVCTKAEALFYQDSGYTIWRVVDGRKVVFRRKIDSDPNAAFIDQFMDVVDAERELAAAGFSVAIDEGLMDDDVHRNDDGNSDDAVSVGAGTSSLSEDASHRVSPKAPQRSGGGIVGASSAGQKHS